MIPDSSQKQTSQPKTSDERYDEWVHADAESFYNEQEEIIANLMKELTALRENLKETHKALYAYDACADICPCCKIGLNTPHERDCYIGKVIEAYRSSSKATLDDEKEKPNE